MTDREKVMEGLQGIDAYFRESFDAMAGTLACELFHKWAEAAEQALALLKEQEPVKPLDENYWKHTRGRCGHCKAPLPAIEGLRSKFCWMCGRPVKWDD